MYLPFGQLETNLVNDTLGLELVSPDQSIGFRETAALMSWSTGGFSLEGYVFNSDADENDSPGDFGLSLGYGKEGFNIGVDYLSNVADSAMVVAALGETEGVAPDGNLNAISINGMVQPGAVTLLAEHIQLDSLDEIGFLSDAAPSFSQIDLGYDLGNGWSLAAACQLTDEGAILGLPESRITASVATTVYDVVAVSLELWHDEDYEVSDGGTGDGFNGVVLQVAAEF